MVFIQTKLNMKVNFIFYTRNVFSLTCTKPKQTIGIGTIFRSFSSYAYGVSLELQELMYPAMDCNRVWKTQLAPMIKRFMQTPHPDQIAGCLEAIDLFKKQRAEVQQHLIDNLPLILEKKTTKADSEYLKKCEKELEKLNTEMESLFGEFIKAQDRLEEQLERLRTTRRDQEENNEKEIKENEEDVKNNENKDNNEGVATKDNVEEKKNNETAEEKKNNETAEEKKNNENKDNNEGVATKDNVEEKKNNETVEESENNEETKERKKALREIFAMLKNYKNEDNNKGVSTKDNEKKNNEKEANNRDDEIKEIYNLLEDVKNNSEGVDTLSEKKK